MTAMVMTACTGQQSDTASQNSDKEFNYVVDQFADLEILRYKVPGFESLSSVCGDYLAYSPQICGE